MFDDDDRVAGIDEFLEHVEELVDICKMKAGGWFVEDVDGFAGRAFGQLFGELDALGLATGQGCGRLTDLDVAEADIEQRLQFLFDRGDILE